MINDINVQDVFGELKRFHIYDHKNEKWVMTGVDFGHSVVVTHGDDTQVTEFNNLDVLTEGRDLQVVWEDEPEDIEDPYLQEVVINMDDSGRIAEIAQDAVADELDVHADDIYISSIEAPNVVTFGRRDNTHE